MGYILKGLNEDSASNKIVMTLDQIEKYLVHDKHGGDNVLDELDGIVHFDL